MKRLICGWMLAVVATTWFGCIGTESTTPLVTHDAEPFNVDEGPATADRQGAAETMLVTLSVPNMV